MEPARASRRRVFRIVFLVTAGLLIVGPYLLRLGFLTRRGFNPDELQHLHSAWCLFQGMLPYRDYFEHHTPWLHFALSALFPFYDLDQDPTAAEALIFTARRSIWIVAGALLVFTFALGRRAGSTRTALASVVLLGNATVFLSKTLEIRPDVPACALVVLAALLASQASRRGLRFHLGAGLCLGAALMFTQKVLFALPGFALAFLLDPSERPNRWRDALVYGAGMAAPVLATLLYFASEGALLRFIDFNFFMNARWKLRLSPWPLFREIFVQNPFLVVLGALGLLRGTVAIAKTRAAAGALGLTVLVAWSLLIGAFIIPVPHRQYAVLFLPFFAILAGTTLVDLAERASKTRTDAVVAIALLVGSIRPLLESRVFWETRNWATLRKIEWVLRNVAPHETVLDGFSGEGVFRPHAYFYYFLHNEMRQMLGEDDWAELLARLKDGSMAPKVVLYDRHLKELPPELREYFESEYLPTGVEPVRARFSPRHWNDTLPRPVAPHLEARAFPLVPYVLTGDGWHPPEAEDRVAFRRSRGRRSELQVPVMSPDDVTAVLDARLEMEGEPVTIELAVNGTALGVQTLQRGWREYGFDVPGSVLVQGLNEFMLTYSKTPVQLGSNRERGNTVVAVRSLTLRPAD